jgi:hypothetical protein
MRRFEMQVKVGQEWESVKPTNSSKYTYTTEREATEMLDVHYPEKVYGIEVRVKEVEV